MSTLPKQTMFLIMVFLPKQLVFTSTVALLLGSLMPNCHPDQPCSLMPKHLVTSGDVTFLSSYLDSSNRILVGKKGISGKKNCRD